MVQHRTKVADDEQPGPKPVDELTLNFLRRRPKPPFGLQIIAEPMWLDQMLRKLGKGVYRTGADQRGLHLFVYDLRLIVRNCIHFNGVSAQKKARGKLRERLRERGGKRHPRKSCHGRRNRMATFDRLNL